MGFYDAIRIGASGASGDYEVQRSLRFNDGDSPSLTRSPSGSGNQSTFTFSWWQKITQPNDYPITFSCGATSITTGFWEMRIGSIGLYLRFKDSSTVVLNSNDKFRDPSAWYHCVIAVDTTQATSSNRIKMYVNNRQITSFENENYPSQNFNNFRVNSTDQHQWGYGKSSSGAVDGPLDSYLAEINFIDGQQLTPSSFAETDATTGQWNPIDTSGLTFGTNGYRLQFADNSGTTATTLGKDSSGNGNNFTPNNFSVAAGVGNDSLEDTPTNNFPTLNPLDVLSGGNTRSLTISEGNLKVAVGSGGEGNVNMTTVANIEIPTSGKWYWEVHVTDVATASASRTHLGIINQAAKFDDGLDLMYADVAGVYAYAADGTKAVSPSGTMTSYGASYTDNDIIGFAVDSDNGSIAFYKNGASQGTAFTGLDMSEGFMPVVGYWGTFNINFGQRAFDYTVPTGYKALNSANLPDPTIKLPNDHFNTVLYTGNNNTSQNITGVGFQPDLVWVKNRDNVERHHLVDAVRGDNKVLFSNEADSERTGSHGAGHTQLNLASDGFNLVSNGSNDELNFGTRTYVAWNWNAGGSTVTNDDGSIDSQVRANTSAGFSIVTYSGNGTDGATVGHGLGVAPDCIITKSRNLGTLGTAGAHWTVAHKGLTNGMNGGSNARKVHLSLTQAEGTNSHGCVSAVSSTTFTLKTGSGNDSDAHVNDASGTYLAYCFSEVAGYSKFGKYTGNNSTDGTFVFTGFQPAYLVIKKTNGTANWIQWDNARMTHNVMETVFELDESGAESGSSNTAVDFLSNGFKFRNNFTKVNGNGDTYIYLCFAESPFKYSRAR